MSHVPRGTFAIPNYFTTFAFMKSSKILGWIAVFAAITLFCIHFYLVLFTSVVSEITWWEILLPFLMGVTLIIFKVTTLVELMKTFWKAIFSRIHKK